MARHSAVEVVGRATEDEREENPDAVGEEDAGCAEDVFPSITLQIRKERAQAFRQHAESVDEILAGWVQDFGRDDCFQGRIRKKSATDFHGSLRIDPSP